MKADVPTETLAADRSDPDMVARIVGSGLFDADFYQTHYAPGLSGEHELVEHFLSTGHERGYPPSERFDPVVYRMLVPECGKANPLLHHLSRGRAFQPPPLDELFPDIEYRREKARAGDRAEQGSSDAPEKDPAAPARSKSAPGEIPFTVKGRRYALKVPPHEELFERLRSDRPFAYARLPHGFWESVWMLHVAERGVAADERARGLSKAEQRGLAERFLAAARWRKGTFAPLFIDESLADIQAHAGHPDFFRAVAFRGSLAINASAVADTWPPRDAVLAQFARHYRPDETIYDAMVWKRLLVRGPLRELPELCRDHPVVLVANHAFATLNKRWKLRRFTHVQIPPRRSHWQRWHVLERARRALAAAAAKAGRPPIVVMQCGGSLAHWLITRLFAQFPAVFYLDLGQALDGWFLDVLDEKFPRDNGRRIIAACGLEEFYRERKKGQYDAWLATFR